MKSRKALRGYDWTGMDLLPNSPAQFATRDYWDSFFEVRKKPFEWYVGLLREISCWKDRSNTASWSFTGMVITMI